MREDASELTSAGWTALSQRRWSHARSLLERAVACDPTGAALEGLGWAAWWLDDAEATLSARERAYRRYREDGDHESAARAAIWLGGDHVDFHGALSIGRGWLACARRLLDDCEPCAEHGWLAFFEGYFALSAGDPAAARGLAASAAESGRTLGVADLEMLGLALEGSARVALAEIAEGMRCLDEAAGTALADEGQLPISTAWTCCLMIGVCESVGDLERAWQWCDRVTEFARRHESAYLFGICRTHYAAAHLLRGEWERCEADLLAAIEDFERSRPPFAGGAIAWLAELRRRQGRVREALALIERAPGHPRALLCRAAVALDAGEALEAAELIERLLRQTPPDARIDRAPAIELLVRSRAHRGELEAAREALAELEETATLVDTAPLRGATALAAGTVQAAAQSHERARVLFEDAIDLFTRCGLPFEAAQARLQLASTLTALGRADSAAREAAAAQSALSGLGAPAAARVRLTGRETEVLRLAAQGLTNGQIAQRLVVSPHTVHRHMTNVLRKLELPSRAAAAAHAAREGLLE